MLKLKDLIIFSNCLFVCDQIKKDLPKVSENHIFKEYDQHNYKTLGTKKTLLEDQIETHRNMVQTQLDQDPYLTRIIFFFYGNENFHNKHKKQSLSTMTIMGAWD